MKFSYRFVIIAALFVTSLLTANIVGVKFFSLTSSVALPAAVILFPLSYILGDVLTEVYGYKQARRVIWLGFLCNLVFVVVASIGRVLLRSSPHIRPCLGTVVRGQCERPWSS